MKLSETIGGDLIVTIIMLLYNSSVMFCHPVCWHADRTISDLIRRHTVIVHSENLQLFISALESGTNMVHSSNRCVT